MTERILVQGQVKDRDAFRRLDGLSFVVLDVMADPEFVAESCDTVLCLSLTKWIHLHHGDDGIRRLFARVRCMLRPGGVLLLEPQSFSSYKKKKRFMTPEMLQTLAAIQLMPDNFVSYLCEHAGFELSVELHPPAPKGFERPVFKFIKKIV